MEPHVSNPTTDLGDLRAFCTVADLGSVTEAARALGETKGSVSRRITRLERALGVMLLRRTPRRVTPTEDGVAYRARVGKALELLDDADAALRNTRADPSGHLRVTAPVDIGARIVAPLVAAFVARWPSVSVEMVLSQQVLDLDGHQLDVALRVAASLPDSSLHALRLLDLESALYAAPGYLSEHPPPGGPEDLREHRLLAQRASQGSGTMTLRTRGEEVAVRIRPVIVASDFSFLREATLAGAGIALLPSFLVSEDLAAGRLTRVLPEHGVPGVPLYFVTSGSRFPPPKVRVFREFVVEFLRSGCGG